MTNTAVINENRHFKLEDGLTEEMYFGIGKMSDERVNRNGEVYTPKHIVNDMIDLIPEDTLLELESTWLEPACGHGNFLVEILRRKLDLIVIEMGEGRDKEAIELDILRAVSTIYGIDITQDNIIRSRARMGVIVETFYETEMGEGLPKKLAESIEYILNANIIHGNSLTGKLEKTIVRGVKKTNDIEGQTMMGGLDDTLYISQWKFKGNKVTREEYTLDQIKDGEEKGTHEYRVMGYLKINKAKRVEEVVTVKEGQAGMGDFG